MAYQGISLRIEGQNISAYCEWQIFLSALIGVTEGLGYIVEKK